MPIQMITSVMEDLLSALKCSRRKETASKKTKKQAGFDYDTDKSTDVGDHSLSEFSDWSASEAETLRQRKVRSGQNPNLRMRPPPGLAMNAPPGLEAPPGLGQGTRLNKQAKVFVPSFAAPAPEPTAAPSNSAHLRQSIRMLKQSLEQLEESHFGAQPPVNDPFQSQELFALREALGRLAPQDAAMVKAFLDSKAEQPASFSPPSLTQAIPPPAAAPMGFGTLDPQNLCHGHFMGPGFPLGHMYGDQPYTKLQGRAPAPQGQHNAARARGDRNPRIAKGTLQAKPVVDDTTESLSTHLRDLAALGNARVIMLRKINHLGLEPNEALEAYFSKFGKIDRVMVSATRSKNAHGTASRLRPATVGFLVMADAGAVDAALACGEDHSVQGVTIIASRFQSHSIDE